MRPGIKLVVGTVSSVLFFSFVGIANGQTTQARRNNPYSPSPIVQASALSVGDRESLSKPVDGRPSGDTSSARDEPKPGTSSLPASNTYRIGVGDVIAITVNYPNTGQTRTSYPVRNDGTIDLPFAAAPIRSSGTTALELRDILTRSIKLFGGAQLEVRVVEFNSHKVAVSGLVQSAGEIKLQREAMPLFTVKAQAGVKDQARRVLITRSNGSKLEIYDLNASETDNVLIYSGDKVDFAGGDD